MVAWHHRFDGPEFEQAPGVGDGQGSLACCSPWGHNELDMTERKQQQQHTADNTQDHHKQQKKKHSQELLVEIIRTETFGLYDFQASVDV